MTIYELIEILEEYGMTYGYDLPVRVRDLDRRMEDVEEVEFYDGYIGIEA